MEQKLTFDEFQSEVIREYESQTYIRKIAKAHANNLPSPAQEAMEMAFGKGLIARGFTQALVLLERGAADDHFQRDSTVKYVSQAKEILALPGIREAICPSVKKAEKAKGLLPEERKIRVIKEIVSAIWDSKYRDEIDWDTQLFAYICYEIIPQGEDTYCINEQL